MNNTYSCLPIHCVWSTKNRHPFLVAPFDTKVYEMIKSVVTKEGGRVLAIGGMPDHIHLLLLVKPAHSIPRILRYAKGVSSRLMSESHIDLQPFSWQKGYGAFAASYSHIEMLTRYIKNQAIHHKDRSFTSEYTLLLKHHNIAPITLDSKDDEDLEDID